MKQVTVKGITVGEDGIPRIRDTKAVVGELLEDMLDNSGGGSTYQDREIVDMWKRKGVELTYEDLGNARLFALKSMGCDYQ